MTRYTWDENELETLRSMYRSAKSINEITKAVGRTSKAVEQKLYSLRIDEGLERAPVSQSTAHEWVDHLTVEGDALIISDLEAPFHHAEIVNRAIDLADAWGIKQLILAGDAVQFSSLSSWPKKFKPVARNASQDERIMRLVNLLPADERAAEVVHLQEQHILSPDDDVEEELFCIRKTFREIGGVFEKIVYLPGNHEDRHITAQGYAEGMTDLLDLFKVVKEKWITTPFYWCMLQTENKIPYRITHPRGAGASNAQRLAEQFHSHVIQGHSHRYSFNLDISGDYFCIQTGHCVDEKRLAYVMQRDAFRKEHALAFTIVRNGVPYLCGHWSDWNSLKKMK